MQSVPITTKVCELDSWIQNGNRRRTDNTKAKRKRTLRTNNNLQNITQKTNDRTTRTPLKTRSELMCSGRVSSSCTTFGNRRVSLVTHPMLSHEWGKDRIVITTNRTYLLSFVTQIFRHTVNVPSNCHVTCVWCVYLC